MPWSVMDRVGLAAAWAAGLLLCAIAASIVDLHARPGPAVREARALTESPIVGSTTETGEESTGGGYKDPIIGTLMLTVLGT